MFFYLLNELGKSDRMQGLSSILSLFRNKFNKFNNTRARIDYSFYHMTLKLVKNHIFGVKSSVFCHFMRNVIKEALRYTTCLYTTRGLFILLHDVISLPEVTSCYKCFFKIISLNFVLGA